MNEQEKLYWPNLNTFDSPPPPYLLYGIWTTNGLRYVVDRVVKGYAALPKWWCIMENIHGEEQAT